MLLQAVASFGIFLSSPIRLEHRTAPLHYTRRRPPDTDTAVPISRVLLLLKYNTPIHVYVCSREKHNIHSGILISLLLLFFTFFFFTLLSLSSSFIMLLSSSSSASYKNATEYTQGRDERTCRVTAYGTYPCPICPILCGSHAGRCFIFIFNRSITRYRPRILYAIIIINLLKISHYKNTLYAHYARLHNICSK